MVTGSMKTIFNFVLEQGGGGDTPGGNVVAQTGDMLAIILTILFAICAIAASVYLIVKAKNFKNATSNGNHAGIKTFVQAKTLIVFLVAMLGIVGAITCAANTSVGRAFASGTSNGTEFKDRVTVTVHEDTKTLSFEDNYFTNGEDDYIHIDRSVLTLSDEAKDLLGDYEPNLTAKYANGDTYIFNGKADGNPYLPSNQIALPNLETQNIVYGTLDFNYDVAKQLCELTDPLTIEVCQAKCYTVTYEKGDADSGTAPRSQTVSQPGQPQVVQTTTKAPDNTGNLQKSGVEFNGWKDENGTHYDVGADIVPSASMSLYPDWKNTSGLRIKFENDGKGKAALEGQTPPATDLVVDLPVNTNYTVSDTGKITFTKPDTTTVAVVPYSENYISYAKWERNGEQTTSGTITDDAPFKVNFTYDEFTITYRGMYDDDPHGKMKPNSEGSGEVFDFSETFQPANPENGQLPKGATAIEDPSKDYDTFFYYFVNWTDEEGNPVVTGSDPKKIVPTEGTGWKDATYIVHFATPKAVYSENGQTGEKLMKFYYDEEPHPEASKKYYVKNSKFVYDEEGLITSVDAPNWFTPTVINQTTGKIVSYSTPLIYPNKVEIDPGFKEYKHLESTDMWFMDGATIAILEAVSSPSMNKNSDTAGLKPREIESIEGLENIYTANIKSTALMFASGVPVAGMLAKMGKLPISVPAVTDTLQSINLSTWTNLPQLSGQMTGMFAGCNGLADLKLPLKSSSNFGEFASDTNAMFLGCTALQSLTINNGFCSSASLMRMMFSYCTSLVEFKQGASSGFGEKAGCDMTKMFEGCTKLNVADISTVSIVEISCTDIFESCGNLVDLRLPEGWSKDSGTMGLNDSHHQWYKVVGEQYQELKETEIGDAGGGTFTRMAPKAIYNEAASTLTFYYDYKTHSDEGTPFLVNTSMPSLDSTISSVFPSWYEAEIFVDNKKVQYVKDLADVDDIQGSKITSNINLKAPAQTVIFDSSFATLTGTEHSLNLIFGWFMADNNPAHNDCFTTFTSTGAGDGAFDNFPTSDVKIWACPFGGFSMEVMCSTFNAMSKRLDDNVIMQYFKDLGNKGEGDNFYTGADTFSSRTSLDLSSLKISSYWIALGLAANSPKLTSITLPNKQASGILSWAFMNCSSLTTISSGFINEQWNVHSIYKMFYGCSDLESVDFSYLVYISEADSGVDKQYYTFKNCNKLKTLTLGEAWTKDDKHITTMEDCSLPGEAWAHQKLDDETLSPSEIPWHNGEGLSGVFTRKSTTTAKEVSFKVVDEQGGTINPNPGKLSIYGDVNFACDGSSIIMGDTVAKAVPNSGYSVKSWKLNGDKVKTTGFGDEYNVISYDSAEKFEFTVSFVSENLTPKAVYNSADKTLSFYYDTETHQGDGNEVFDVYSNTYINIDVDSGKVSAKLPAWYDYTISKEFDWENPAAFTFNPQLKIDATEVIFTNSFKDYDDLESISMWFMADRSGKQPFKDFYSTDEDGKLVEGFSNINTVSLENVAFAFGGFSIFPSLVTSDGAKDMMFNNFTQKSKDLVATLKSVAGQLASLDTYGTSLQDIDISTFDADHNVSNFAGMFCNCTALYSIELGENIADANITNMDAMFQNCESLGMKPGSTELIGNLDKLNTSNVTSMNLLFFGDSGIKSLDLSNFDTSKTFASIVNGLPTWNTILMFWDCTRINSITTNTKFTSGFSGWTVPLEKCYLLDNNDPDSPKEPTINVWTNSKYEGTNWNSTALIPFDASSSYPPKEETTYTGTFERKALNESKTIFTTNGTDKGLVNGQESVEYSYIQTDNVRLDSNNPSDMLSDNFRITPEAKDTYKFDHWETGEGFDEEGKVVTLQDKWLFDAEKGEAKTRTLVAVFESEDLSAKAVYEKPTEANGDGKLTFYYDADPHIADNTVVFDVNPNTSVYDLPAWYVTSDIDPWVEGDDRPIPWFNSEIDNGSGRPDKIVVEFDNSFSQYKQLTSLSCWFMPAIDRSDRNKLYSPFQFDSSSFKNLDYINTVSVYNLWYMFGGHENANEYAGSHITSIDLTNFDQSHNLKNLDGMFANCCDLTSLTLPSNFGQNCTSMSHTFFNCRALTGDYLKTALSPMTTKGVTDMSYMFASYKDSTGKTPLKESITLSFPETFNTASVANFEGIFAGYTNTEKLIITDEKQAIGQPHKGCSWDYLFANNHSLTSSLKSIDWQNLSWFNTQYANSMKGVFMNNTSIANLNFITANDANVVHFDTSSVNDMSYMFSGCTSLTSFDFSTAPINTSALENANRMFSGCSSLAIVKLDRSKYGDVHRSILSAMYMFENCPLLTSVDLSRAYVSTELIPEDETGADTSSMVNSVYNMFANTASNGNVTKNSTITEFTIAEDWELPMDVTGLATVNASSEPVLWYNKADVTLAGFPASDVPPANPSEQPDKSVTKYGTYTNKEPFNFSISVNKKLWGSVKNLASAMLPGYEFSRFMDSVQLSVVNGVNYGQTEPVLCIKFNNFETPLPLVPVANNSKFAGWKIYKEGQTDPIALKVGDTTLELTSNFEIQAEFSEGVVPVYAYVPASDDNKKLIFGCYTVDDANAQIPTIEAMGGICGFFPDDGDFSEVGGIPWANVAGAITDVEISESFAYCSDFTTFKDWFKGISKVEGIGGLYYLDSTNVTDFSGMFEGCTNIKELILGIEPAATGDEPSVRVNENPVNTSNMFKGCSKLETLAFNGFRNIETGTDMFSGCSSLNNILLDQKLNKKLHTDLALPESNWSYSGQKSLDVYSADDIQDNMRIAKSLSFFVGECVLARVTDTATISPNNTEYGKVTDQLASEQYFDSLTAHFNEAGGFSCAAKATPTSLILTFTDALQGYEFDGVVTSWTITINQKSIKDGYTFYQWNKDDSEIEGAGGVPLINGDAIKAVFDLNRTFVAVLSGNTLTFYNDSLPHEDEDVRIEVPNQWYTKSGGTEASPFAEVATATTTITFDDSVMTYKSLYETWCWFKGFSNLTTINNLENLKLANVTNFGHMFEECTNLTNLNLSLNDTNIKQASFMKMFNNCKNLAELDISNFQTDGSFILGAPPAEQMLSGCTDLNKISFGSNWKKTPLSACAGDISQKWVNVNDALSVRFDQFPNTEFANAGTFEVAKYQATFSAPSDVAGVFQISMNEIYFSDDLTAEYKIDATTKFMTIVLENSTGDSNEYPISVRRLDYTKMFKCWTLNGDEISGEKAVADGDNFVINVVDDNNKALAWYDSGTHVLHFSYDEEGHSEYNKMSIDPNWTGETTQFANFFHVDEIEQVTFEPSFKAYTDLTSLKSWFNGFKTLSQINNLDNITVDYVWDMSMLFNECTSLCQKDNNKTLNLSSWNTSNVITMERMFNACYGLEHLVFGGKFDTSKVDNFNSMFNAMSSLKELDLSSFKIGTKSKGIPVINYMISDLTEATTINVAVSECKYNYLMEGYDSGAQWNFGNCPKIQKIISNGKLSFDLQIFGITGEWMEPSGDRWWNMRIEQDGTYVRLATISFKSSDMFGGTFDDGSNIAFNPEEVYAVATPAVDGTPDIAIDLCYLDGTPYANYSRHVSIIDGSSYTFKGWKYDPEPTEGKIVSDTQVVALIEDSNKARAYFDEATNTLSFYYDDQDHGDNYVDVPKAWGVPGESVNAGDEWEKSPFANYAETTTSVVFDDSFANCKGILSLCAWFKGFNKVTSYTGLQNIDSTNIGFGASPGCMNLFCDNSSLKSVDVSKLSTSGDPDREIPACTNFMKMFKNCSSLETITFVDEDGSSAFTLQEDCAGMFERCSKLTNIDFSYIDKDREIKNAESMFLNCYKLQTIDFGHYFIASDYAFNSMIDRCFSLQSIKFDSDMFDRFRENQFMTLRPVWGKWYIDNEPITNWKIDGTVKKGIFSRNPDELVTISLEAEGAGAENGVVCVEGYNYYEGGAITEIVLPKGTELKHDDYTSDAYASFTDDTEQPISWSFILRCVDTTEQYKPWWTFISPYKVEKTDTLKYTVDNPKLQVNPVLPESDEDAPLAAAGALAVPALAAFGFRKRLRGKHAKI